MTQIIGKDAPLEQTIDLFIKRLTELGLDLEFKELQNPCKDIYSIILADKHCKNISTNGKGTSLLAAKASACGEMAERFLNQAFFEDFWLGKEIANSKITRYKDEQWIPYPKAITQSPNGFYYFRKYVQYLISCYKDNIGTITKHDINDKEALLDIFDNNILFKLEDIKIPSELFYPEFINDLNVNFCRPFTDYVTSNVNRGISALPLKLENSTDTTEPQVALFPIRYMEATFCTNGLCAGNSEYEAKVQGLSEIFERFVRRFLYGQITAKENLELSKIKSRALPKIPTEYLKLKHPEILNLISQFREHNVEITCYDASLGGKFPVVAILANVIATKQYKISLGSHPNIGIALSRTITELMQGFNWNTIEYNDLESLVSQYYSLENSNEPPMDPDFNFIRNYMDDSGEIYLSFFSEESEFDFVDWSFEGRTTKEEYEHLVDIINSLGKKLWCYDASYKELHAYKLIVPNFSEINRFESFDQESECIEVDTIEYLTRINNLNEQEALRLASYISDNFSTSRTLHKVMGLMNTEDNPLQSILNYTLFEEIFTEDMKISAKKYKDFADLSKEQKIELLKELVLICQISKNTALTKKKLNKLLEKFSISESTIKLLQKGSSQIPLYQLLEPLNENFENFPTQKRLIDLHKIRLQKCCK